MDDNKAFALIVSLLIIAGGTALSINAYQEGETNQLEIQLKIEQEKNKNHERADTTWHD